MGNSTRCHAIMENLVAAGCSVHVLTSGNGLDYFAKCSGIASLHEMPAFYYSTDSKGGVSGWATLRSTASLAKLFRLKSQRLHEIISKVNPDVAVIDSEYALAPLRKNRIPIVAINNSEIVVTEFLKFRKESRGVHSHFWLVEFSDYLFHLNCCDLVLSPFPLRSLTRHPKFVRTGLIVRKGSSDFLTSNASLNIKPRQLQKVVFMLSGSIHASKVDFSGRQFPFAIEVIGRDGESSENVKYHGRQINSLPILASADALVINGGYSALSEAFALRKPTFVLPVLGHAEQLVNANLVARFGLGFKVTEDNVLDVLLGMYNQDEWIGRQPMHHNFETNGDVEAAQAVLACVLARGDKFRMLHDSRTAVARCSEESCLDKFNGAVVSG